MRSRHYVVGLLDALATPGVSKDSSPQATERRVTEKNTRLTSAEIALARLREMANDVGLSKTQSENQAPEKSLRANVRDLDIASDLLEAARMACGDLPPDASSRLRTLLLVVRGLCGTGVERDFHDLIEAASIACLPPKKSGALQMLLRVASGKLDEARASVDGGNNAAAAADPPGRPSGSNRTSGPSPR